MKTYQSSTNEKKRGFFKRHWHAFALTGAVLAVALIITLSVVFSSPGSEPAQDVVDPPASEVVTEPKVVMPMTGSDRGLDYAIDSLKWWDTLEVWKVHPAIDFVGEGNVVAITDGTVKDVEKTTLEGMVVTVEHVNGYVALYKSLEDVAVNIGDKVSAGDRLGSTGSSMAELNTGKHLHLELKKDGKYVDPAAVLPSVSDK